MLDQLDFTQTNSNMETPKGTFVKLPFKISLLLGMNVLIAIKAEKSPGFRGISLAISTRVRIHMLWFSIHTIEVYRSQPVRQHRVDQHRRANVCAVKMHTFQGQLLL